MHHQRTLESSCRNPASSAAYAAGVTFAARNAVALMPPASVIIAAWRVTLAASCSTAICSGDTAGGYESATSPRHPLCRSVLMPRREASGLDELHDLVGDVGVEPDVLHVVEVFAGIDHAQDLASAFLF